MEYLHTGQKTKRERKPHFQDCLLWARQFIHVSSLNSSPALRSRHCNPHFTGEDVEPLNKVTDKYGKGQDLDQTCPVVCCLLGQSPASKMCHLWSRVRPVITNSSHHFTPAPSPPGTSLPAQMALPLCLCISYSSPALFPVISVLSAWLKGASNRESCRILPTVTKHSLLCMDCSQGIAPHCITFIPLALGHKYSNMSVAPTQLWNLYSRNHI